MAEQNPKRRRKSKGAATKARSEGSAERKRSAKSSGERKAGGDSAERKRSAKSSGSRKGSRKTDPAAAVDERQSSDSKGRKSKGREAGSGSAERKRSAKAAGRRKSGSGSTKRKPEPVVIADDNPGSNSKSRKDKGRDAGGRKPAKPRRAARAPETAGGSRLPWAIAGGLAVACMILLGMLLGGGSTSKPEGPTKVAESGADAGVMPDKTESPDLGDEPISLAELRKGGAPGFSAAADMKRRDAPTDTPAGYDAEQAAPKDSPPENSEPAPETPTTPTPRGGTEKVKVKHVIDGDTAILTDGRRLRFIGINTPERDTPLYQEAKDFTRKLIGGREITIAFDKERKDRFGRTLAYLYVGDTFVNAELVKAGLAYFYEFKPNTRHSKLFRGLQQEARKRGEYLWKAPVKLEDYYIGARRSHRFHRPGCKRARSQDRKTRWKHRDEALDAGLNPCGDCLP